MKICPHTKANGRLLAVIKVSYLINLSLSFIVSKANTFFHQKDILFFCFKYYATSFLIFSSEKHVLKFIDWSVVIWRKSVVLLGVLSMIAFPPSMKLSTKSSLQWLCYSIYVSRLFIYLNNMCVCVRACACVCVWVCMCLFVCFRPRHWDVSKG